MDQGGLSLQRDQYINKSIDTDKVCHANGIFRFLSDLRKILFCFKYFSRLTKLRWPLFSRENATGVTMKIFIEKYMTGIYGGRPVFELWRSVANSETSRRSRWILKGGERGWASSPAKESGQHCKLLQREPAAIRFFLPLDAKQSNNAWTPSLRKDSATQRTPVYRSPYCCIIN